MLVSVVVPVYNSAKYLKPCIESILNQDYPKDKLEVLFVDGKSTDDTVSIIRNYTKDRPYVRILINEQQTVQHALNIGLQEAKGEYFIRFDSHTEYAEDYISKCVSYLQKTEADNVGGPLNATGLNFMQKVIAAMYSSPFALGGGRWLIEDFEGYADTVYLGAYKREKLIEIGMYDEDLPRSEDDELNYRLTKSGGIIYITPEIKSTYYPRETISGLFVQYYEYGLWKPAVIKKHKKPARLSHLVPMLFVLFLVFGGVGAIFSPVLRAGYLFTLLCYLFLDIYYSFKNKKAEDFKSKLALCLIHFVVHLSYGTGFIQGMFKFYFNKNFK